MPWPGTAFFVLAMFSAFSNSTAWGNCEAGFDALDRVDYEQALRHFLSCAEAGDAVAQFNVGLMYASGEGASTDDAEAARWYRRAARQGHVTAQYNLGVMYANGDGVPQDDAEAARWFRLSAEQGDAMAQHNLGFMYEKGRGVVQDDVEAVRWYRMAADQGLPDAQHNLGLSYADGYGRTAGRPLGLYVAEPRRRSFASRRAAEDFSPAARRGCRAIEPGSAYSRARIGAELATQCRSEIRRRIERPR